MYKFCTVCSSLPFFVIPLYSNTNAARFVIPSLILHYKLYPVCNSSFTYTAQFVIHHLKNHIRFVIPLYSNTNAARFVIPSLILHLQIMHGLWFPFTNTACPCTNSAQFVVPSLLQILLPFTKTAWFC